MGRSDDRTYDLEPHELENLRRSIVILRPGQAATLDRDRAVRLLEELQRLQVSDRRYRRLVDQLRALLASGGASGEGTPLPNPP
jgi:hypothetical protein